jgi:hypothetical protein
LLCHFLQSLVTGEATKLESLAVKAISHTTRPIEHKAPIKKYELSPQLSKLSLSPENEHFCPKRPERQ